jgi:asparagine synthase (glutamine-hydrolysing)
MCGIWTLIGEHITMSEISSCLKKLSRRGPEDTRMFFGNKYQFGFTRLALNGLNNHGMQPMHHNYTDWICNGEIYNWKTLADEIGFVSKRLKPYRSKYK